MINLTEGNFQRELAAQTLPVLVIFRAGFCGPSAALDPIIDQIVEDYDGRIATAIVDVEECPKMTREMQVKGTPTAIIFNLGVPLASRIGTMTYDEFADWLEEMACKG